ncbi:S41 family peptidase [Pseudoalteromonas sp. APC 3358]|uniref:S41 family peptidase n=1 Tax=Pseudoalteromonas sp. APC 3358 TaxID=3035176 RepID=UPI0025B345BF|nr:S41 family peptidase [Pseudoalteromonas sp. APC 3358]MDN3384102.1 S41 family peptidase [Pseudoalteromonas sp. APC 3358]
MTIKTKIINYVLLPTLLLSPLVNAGHEQAVPTTPEQWRSVTNSDIEAAYSISAQNHPGMFDVNNPTFPDLLKQAKAEALTLSAQASGPQVHVAAIARLSTVLQDGHAGAFSSVNRPARRWPGFSAVWRGDALKVYYSEASNISKGDVVSQCDGQSTDTLMRERIFKFHGEVAQPGHWWQQGWRLLIDEGNPFLTPLKECEFVKANGDTYTQALNWSVKPKSASKHLENAYNGDELPIDLTWPEKNIGWIAMPSFSSTDKQTAAYNKVFEKIQQQRSKLLTAKAVVLDLRHNQGGSSYWSSQIAKGLWGQKVVEQKANNTSQNTQVWWRASKDNTGYVESLFSVVKDQPEVLKTLKTVAAGMALSLENDAPFYVEEKTNTLNNIPHTPLVSDFKTKVFVIVPPQCASACLDALDKFKLFENTTLFGAPSSADSMYMEVRLADLPSGLGKVIVPNKVYVNRARGAGAYYKPDIAYNGIDWTTNRLLEQIKKY